MSNGAPPPVPGSAAPKKGLSPLAWTAIGCGGLIVVGLAVFLILGALVFKKGKEVAKEATGSESVEEFLEGIRENPAKTVAETAVRVNPDLELISTDDEAGTITFTNTRTGEQATLNFEDIAEGRFSMATSQSDAAGEGSMEGQLIGSQDGGEFRIDVGEGGEGGVTFTGPDGEETRIGGAADLTDVPEWVPAYPGATQVHQVLSSTGPAGVRGSRTAKTSDGAQKVLDHFKQLFENEGYEIGAESMTRTGDGAFGAIDGKLGEGRSVNVVIIEGGGSTQVTINYNQKKP